MTVDENSLLLPDARALVTAAARCWRTVRDECAPVQQRLYALLDRQDCGMLAPVFDSLMGLCEAALGRRIAIGSTGLSADERMLLDLLDGARPARTCGACGEGMTSALACAICSTRIMIATTFAPNRRLAAG